MQYCQYTSTFPTKLGLHQRSLSQNPFALVIDDLSMHIQDEVQWRMIFATNIVLFDETRVGINYKLKLQREALESKGFKVRKVKLNIWV